MRRIRVLIVDDAVAVRRLTTIALSEDPCIEVVGTAVHGRVALDEVPRLQPDVVVLDVEMPVMNGLDTIVELRRQHPGVAAIMFSNYTLDGAAVTIEALSLGAADYLAKPVLTDGPSAAVESIRAQLAPKIKALCPDLAGIAAVHHDEVHRAAQQRLSPSRTDRIDIVAIGTSVGGPAALSAILTRLPPSFPVPVVIVQHMPPLFTHELAKNLAGKASIEVCEAVRGQVLRPATVWIAPGDFHMVLVRKESKVAIETHQGPRVNSCRPSVDELFQSVAELYGPRALAVILTGMGHDGQRGCEAIRKEGGRVLVQDEPSSVVWGMPGSVAKSGLANNVLPLDQMAAEIVRAASVARHDVDRVSTAAFTSVAGKDLYIDGEDSRFIRKLVHERSGIALSEDKDYLLQQRLGPILIQHRFASVAALVGALRDRPIRNLHLQVVEALATQETLFFRDFYPFEVLRKVVLPELIERRKAERRLTIWSIGCSSGQELYSIAMLLRDHFPHLNNWRIELVGCDLSPTMIARARQGRYSQMEINRGLPAALLIKYFEKVANYWQIVDEIRQTVNFRELNVANFVPEGTSADITFMRNLLIYFEVATKKAALDKVRRLLKSDGYLFLGSGETTLNLDDAFERVQAERADYYQLRAR